MGKLEWTFAVLTVWKLLFGLMLLAHWQACLWALIPGLMPEEETTWRSAYVQGEEAMGRTVGPIDLYITSLYWSIMTLTSIGYGDFVPKTTIERGLTCVYMMLSAGSWCFVIGTAAGIATTLDPGNVAYKVTMDQLNHFMRERELPREMRMMLRSYFEAARQVHRSDAHSALLAQMSPLLQGSVAWKANKPWLDKVWFLRELHSSREEREFIAELSMKMQVHAYVASERVPIGQLNVLRKGMCVRLWRFLGVNAVWGDDMLLDDLDLVCHAQAVALTYIECTVLSKPSFEEAARDFPGPMATVRKKLKRVKIRRRLLIYFAKATGYRGARSFVQRDHASGFSYAHKQHMIDGDEGGGGGSVATGEVNTGVLEQLAALRESQHELAVKVQEAQRLSDARMAKMTSALSAIQAAFEVWAGVPPAPASAQPPGPPSQRAASAVVLSPRLDAQTEGMRVDA